MLQSVNALGNPHLDDFLGQQKFLGPEYKDFLVG